MTTKIGFIGASVNGSWAELSHMPYFNSPRAKETGAYKIIALQNSSIASAEKSAKAFNLGDVKTYDTPQALAADPDVDLVAVSIKAPSHFDALLPALEAGKGVFSEWPLGRNLKEAERLTSLAREKGVKTLIGLQARQSPSILAVKKIIDSGELGEILATTMHGYGTLFGPQVTPEYSYTVDIDTGANILTVPFSHAVDALCWILGELDYVQATLANRRTELDHIKPDGTFVEKLSKTAHDFVAVTGVLKNSGAPVNVVYEGGLNPQGKPSFFWQINGTKGSLLLESPMGHVQMWQPTVKIIKNGEKEAKDVEGIKLYNDDFSYNVGQAWEALAGVGDGNVTTWEDALVRHKMIDAIYRSNEKGTRESYV